MLDTWASGLLAAAVTGSLGEASLLLLIRRYLGFSGAGSEASGSLLSGNFMFWGYFGRLPKYPQKGGQSYPHDLYLRFVGIFLIT